MSAGTAAPQGSQAVERGVAAMLRATSLRPLTAAEVADKLRASGLDDEQVAVAAARLAAVGAVDDRAFASAWVGDRGLRRGYGAARLRQELRRRRVPEPVLEEALAQLDSRDEAAEAVRLGRERWSRLPASLEPAAAARRIVGCLVRRGYPPALAERAARKATHLDDDWD